MFENQVTALTAILKDKDIQEYAGDAFWNIIKAVSLGDVGHCSTRLLMLKTYYFTPRLFAYV